MTEYTRELQRVQVTNWIVRETETILMLIETIILIYILIILTVSLILLNKQIDVFSTSLLLPIAMNSAP